MKVLVIYIVVEFFDENVPNNVIGRIVCIDVSVLKLTSGCYTLFERYHYIGHSSLFEHYIGHSIRAFRVYESDTELVPH